MELDKGEMLRFNLANKDRMVSFARRMGVSCNLEDPRTIQEKLMWLNIYDVDPMKSMCADKLKVKDWVKDRLGKDICVPTLKVWDKADGVSVDGLPKSFVLKCNHGSGMNIIVNDRDKLNVSKAKADLKRWMGRDFAFQNGFESHYHWIDRKVFAEEMLGNGDGKLLDYKFWCFNGEPAFWTMNDGNGHGDIMYYMMDGSEWNPYMVRKHNNYIKPNSFDEMVEFSKKLCKLFKFVRVDFYEANNKVYLGEMTFTPGANVFKYKKNEDNIFAGNFLNYEG